ncbi:hypothetical protein BSKO_06766 [Bryopsis sp. KO-2023]|nr:hypothetical protein BSKO_06766 [Bryopsis sp. KO-2023]
MSPYSAATVIILLAIQGSWADRLLQQSLYGSFPAPLFPTCKFKSKAGGGRWRGCSVKVPAKATACSVVFRGGIPRASCATTPGIGTFGSFVDVQIPDLSGVVSCTITPGGINKAPKIDCSTNKPPSVPGSPPGGPIVIGRTFIPPPGSGSCVATNLQAGQTPSITCTPATNGQTPFRPGASITIPTGEFGRCTFGADDNGEPVIGCVGIPPSIPGPGPGPSPSEPVINGNTITPPPGSKSCEASRSAAGADFIVSCEQAGPGETSFAPGVTFDFSDGSGRCTYDAGPDGQPLIACVGIPLTAPNPVPPPLFIDPGGVPVPDPVSPPKGKKPKGKNPIVVGNLLIPPPGSASCTISRGGAGGTPTATCSPPTEAGGATFKLGFTFEFPASAGRCNVEATSGGDPVIGCVGIPLQQP